jgi:hypothetical protein
VLRWAGAKLRFAQMSHFVAFGRIALAGWGARGQAELGLLNGFVCRVEEAAERGMRFLRYWPRLVGFVWKYAFARGGWGLSEVAGAVRARRGWAVWTARATVIGPPFS